MKLYMVFYVAGLIGGTVGPFPFGMKECERHVAEIMSDANRHNVIPPGYTANDVRLACEWHTVRPKIDPNAGKPR